MSDSDKDQAIFDLLQEIASQPGEMAQYAQKYLKYIDDGTWKLSDLPKYFSVQELSMYLKDK